MALPFSDLVSFPIPTAPPRESSVLQITNLKRRRYGFDVGERMKERGVPQSHTLHNPDSV